MHMSWPTIEADQVAALASVVQAVAVCPPSSWPRSRCAGTAATAEWTGCWSSTRSWCPAISAAKRHKYPYLHDWGRNRSKDFPQAAGSSSDVD
ncbi:hypothetical protein HCN51_03235 [Nonomuraea sp. FMUSA5-5]|uniref:Uncharacterized protein n=1 Tax=Nonomuraea composti TaxID=2720023 RepID=A0ABX1AS91_9ACTN|nr:hypothetical protein [Nonomuraea sp. FMUSA5-5]NJP88478.1 hypothetical protein [Nonomuraea sp. FMUSA5-5]